MSDSITYNLGAVHGFAADTGSRAAQLMEIHADILQRTNALAEFFSGHGATGFFDAQAQMLHGLEGLIATVSRHGSTVNNVADSAAATDQQIAGLF